MAAQMASAALLFLACDERASFDAYHLERLVALTSLDCRAGGVGDGVDAGGVGVARKRPLLYVVLTLMRTACDPAAAEVLGGLWAHGRLCALIRACGARDLELVEACVSALWVLSFSGRNRARAALGHVPELMVSLLQVRDR